MKDNPFTLVVENAYVPGKHKAFAFAKDRVSIGRARANDVMLANAMRLVSRIHAEIRKEGGAFWLVDLGSKNATWLNGKRIEAKRPYPLHHGDHFYVGDYQIEFVAA
jgi:pSer/pThr/pTyr-binding forkhead associated (FHA) protein